MKTRNKTLEKKSLCNFYLIGNYYKDSNCFSYNNKIITKKQKKIKKKSKRDKSINFIIY